MKDRHKLPRDESACLDQSIMTPLCFSCGRQLEPSSHKADGWYCATLGCDNIATLSRAEIEGRWLLLVATS